MSHIPNSAIPHARASNDETDNQTSSDSALFRGAGAVAEKIREYPKTAMAAGAVLAAGAVAAAAVPLMRGRKGSEEGGNSGTSE